MNNYRYLETFIAVADAKGITPAAKRLRVSKSVVSKRIQDLERATNTTLIWRDNRNFHLTNAGQKFLVQAKIAMHEVQKAFGLVERLQTSPSGLIRITSPVTFGKKYLLDLVFDFHRQNPSIEIDLSLHDHYIALVEQGYDFAFRLIREPDQSLHQRSLFKTDRIFCASRKYLEDKGIPGNITDLSNYVVFTMSRKELGVYIKDGTKRIKMPVNSGIKLNNLEAIYQAVLNGWGIGILPTYLVNNDLAEKKLIRIFEDFSPVTPFYNHVSLVYRPEKNINPKLRLFINFVTDWFRNIDLNGCLKKPDLFR